jgi:uncharacterized protein with FMN-binding domain
MKRAIIVSSATVAGLAGVLAFHTAPVGMTIGALPTSAGASTQSVPSTTVAAAPPPNSGATTTIAPKKRPTTPTTQPKSPSTTVPATTTTAIPGARTATGQEVNYYFGVLSVKVTAVGKRVSKVSIATLSDGGNYLSQSIDQQSIPQLEQEAMQAQSANIQSISGARYTSAGFAQSLQSALTKLGI